MRHRWFILPLWTVLALILWATASPLTIATSADEERSQETLPQAAWPELLKRRPYPYLIPIPEPKLTELDGTYTKIVASPAEHVHCLRCPDYAPEGGLWKLRLDKGTFYILHADSGWKSVGTVLVTKERLLLANDPNCIDGLGLYRWRLEKGRLNLEVLDDPCAIKLRAMNLTLQPWLSCRPPNLEAAITGHWPKPAGCD
jgi:hypothetical protein